MRRIIVESREPEEIAAMLRKKGLWVERKQFEPGDYLISDKICLERKSITDFIRSIYDGRIFNQARRMSDLFDRVILVVEGDPEGILDHREKKILYSAIASLIFNNVSVVQVKDRSSFVEFLASLASKTEGRSEPILVRHVGRLKNDYETAIQVLCGFPGVGIKLAERLIKRFGSLRRIFSATYAELKPILGEKRAQAFLEMLDKRITEKEGRRPEELRF